MIPDVSEGERIFVLVTGAGATSFLWNPVVRELVLRGYRALPVELPGHGFDTVFPEGFGSPHDPERFARSPSPLAGLGLDDYVDHTLDVVRRVADHGPVVLVGHSLGGSTVTRVANAAPHLLAGVVYLSAYCCVDQAVVPAYAPSQPPHDSPLGRARRVAFVGDPGAIGAARTNPRTADPDVLAVQHALLMADFDPAHVPAVLAYATQPDEPLGVILTDARVDPRTWGRLPRTYIRTDQDEVVPVQVQDRMIGEADRLTPDNPFTVHTVAASHFAPITHAAEVADILAGARTSRDP
jgi:pimeloyl-ACP methyl ester carboxylesterase